MSVWHELKHNPGDSLLLYCWYPVRDKNNEPLLDRLHSQHVAAELFSLESRLASGCIINRLLLLLINLNTVKGLDSSLQSNAQCFYLFFK